MPEKSEDGHQFRRGVSRLRELANAQLATRVRKPLPDKGILPSLAVRKSRACQRSAPHRECAKEEVMSKQWLYAPVLSLLLLAPSAPSMAQSVGDTARAELNVQPSEECIEDYALVYPCSASPRTAEGPQGMTGTERQIARPSPDKARPDTAIH
jgi:hypothetical protein